MSRNSNHYNTVATPNPKKKRAVKDLPSSLVDVFNKDSYDGDLTSVIKFRLEDRKVTISEFKQIERNKRC